jgi:hypothetical protein
MLYSNARIISLSDENAEGPIENAIDQIFWRNSLKTINKENDLNLSRRSIHGSMHQVPVRM